jgi:hypothetical protein
MAEEGQQNVPVVAEAHQVDTFHPPEKMLASTLRTRMLINPAPPSEPATALRGCTSEINFRAIYP